MLIQDGTFGPCRRSGVSTAGVAHGGKFKLLDVIRTGNTVTLGTGNAHVPRLTMTVSCS